MSAPLQVRAPVVEDFDESTAAVWADEDEAADEPEDVDPVDWAVTDDEAEPDDVEPTPPPQPPPPQPAPPPPSPEPPREPTWQWAIFLKSAFETVVGEGVVPQELQVDLQSTLHRAFEAGGDAPLHTAPARISLCQTCFRRGFQLRCTLHANMLQLWRWRGAACLYLVLFGEEETQELSEWIEKEFQIPLAAGLLVVASSPMKWWHSSIAKNTAHVLALAEHGVHDPDAHLLVNLDADNIIGRTFVETALDQVLLTYLNALFFEFSLAVAMPLFSQHPPCVVFCPT